MQHRKAIILLFSIFGFEVLCRSSFGQNTSGTTRIMFYNVENAFDTSDDTATNDDDFLPDGLFRWNESRYWKKISSLYKTIVAAGEWEPPELVAFCEVENRKVLEDLVHGTYLSKYNYSIVHEDSPDRRGIDVCLIYRKDAVRIAGYKYLKPGSLPDPFTSRSVLYVKVYSGIDTIHLFVNHWPSRKGGVLAGENLRLTIAEMVKSKIDSLEEKYDGKARIIVTGDFNSTPGDPEIMRLLSFNGRNAKMVNLSENFKDAEGTYKYLGAWEMIDQMIVSENLLNKGSGCFVENKSLAVFKPEFLIIKDPKYPGTMPFATYRGYKYQGGFSDHLPIILTLFRSLD